MESIDHTFYGLFECDFPYRGTIFISTLVDMNYNAEAAILDGAGRAEGIYQSDFIARLNTV